MEPKDDDENNAIVCTVDSLDGNTRERVRGPWKTVVSGGQKRSAYPETTWGFLQPRLWE